MMGGRKITLLDEAFLGWEAIFSTRVLAASLDLCMCPLTRRGKLSTMLWHLVTTLGEERKPRSLILNDKKT
jgi:hypothetical protein